MVCLPIYLSVSLTLCMYVCLSVHLSNSLHLCHSVDLFSYTFICQVIHIYVFLPPYFSISIHVPPSVYLYILYTLLCQFEYLSVYLKLCLSSCPYVFLYVSPSFQYFVFCFMSVFGLCFQLGICLPQ